MRYVYGLDFASKNDYFATIIHELPNSEENVKVMPRIKTLRNITRMDYSRSLSILTGELFKKYPPYCVVTDYAAEKTITDLLIRRLGSNRVIALNTNTLPTKQMLKDDGLSILQQGYQFPNPKYIQNKELSSLVEKLIEQLMSEEIIITPSGKTSFNHPQGEHNDLAIAWELSIHGCYKFILSEGSKLTVSTRKYRNEIDSIEKSAFSNRPDITILSRQYYDPSQNRY